MIVRIESDDLACPTEAADRPGSAKAIWRCRSRGRARRGDAGWPLVRPCADHCSEEGGGTIEQRNRISSSLPMVMRKMLRQAIRGHLRRQATVAKALSKGIERGLPSRAGRLPGRIGDARLDIGLPSGESAASSSLRHFSCAGGSSMELTDPRSAASRLPSPGCRDIDARAPGQHVGALTKTRRLEVAGRRSAQGPGASPVSGAR